MVSPLELRADALQQYIVTATQMRQIEERVFAAGMPVAALMEKVGGLLARRILELVQPDRQPTFGVLVGPGHNGADALVVARELYLQGCGVQIFCPFSQRKDLTEQHARYCQHLGIPFVEAVDALVACQWLLDGFFGFGLERSLSPDLAQMVEHINQWGKPVISIDLPSGIHTDTGQALGAAIRASHTLCLGLWKQGVLQDGALEWVGRAELIDFGLPLEDVLAILGEQPPVQRLHARWVAQHLPLPRSLTTYKYQVGHLLLICGSRRYAGGAVLSALGARASGVGMLTIAAPASLKSVLTHQLPEAIVWDCPETTTGAIAQLPTLDFNLFQAIAIGPGLTPEATDIVTQMLHCDCPLVLDADALNILATKGIATISSRQPPTILTPHLGEFKRLFPDLTESLVCRITATRAAAQLSGATVLLKGARGVIADPDGATWLNPESTPGLARGGSGDVLTGLIGGLLAQMPNGNRTLEAGAIATWLHAQAAIQLAQTFSELGVHPANLSEQILRVLGDLQHQFLP